MRRYRVGPAHSAKLDLLRIESFLANSYEDFGDDAVRAEDRAESRMLRAVAKLRILERYPHRGTLLPDMQPALRSFTHQGFIFYFEIDETHHVVTILAGFCGGADHRRQIIERLAPS